MSMSKNPQHHSDTCTRRIVTWRALGIDEHGDAQEGDTYDDGPVSRREHDAMALAQAMLDKYPCAVVESGIAWWAESEGKLDEDMQTVAVFGDRTAAIAGGWCE